MRQIILDTETTGLDPQQGHRIIEFAGLEMVGRKLTGKHLHLYIHPQREIDPDAQRVHGISLEFLDGKPVFSKVGQEIADFLRGAELIIHNAPFDIGFLNAEFAKIGIEPIDKLCASVIDTLREARDMFPGKRNSLDALCDRFEIDRSNRTLHGALVDCELLSEVYLWMTRGQESLAMDIEVELPGDAGAIQFERKPLKVLAASEAEEAEHQAYLDVLDKTVKGACVWRGLEQPAQAGD
ncbi:DNA polymerase III subunit epsilon [Chromobacterium vaccinii]|uniref:DNA polymerase III subunit epsilon n=3 Tax=Chromobacteriaceae TaxID=1499392 RepID=A0A1D9LL08_9NEIS|nr:MULTISPECIES: DNA polymerase III subunit epsilon [Chromobacteriaceae]AOZ51911.1 DNA polymerase III subunit epsilon [Chromobacterium vaccinii]AVG16200.1 DNA polymerase III subunit epsilon [Chromobacterium vaccinii]ERE06871.1 DNA polymerase III subunit epsilon [Pseudogulbenkiania ferrooxidans EGD-HP2]MCD4484706.1 DNA polymerase III subunit epsilon [Chromobacterium vaccinii]MCD4499655.1 DNA polymerase III subunit epsilon [Chromobacterium vaccinii]